MQTANTLNIAPVESGKYNESFFSKTYGEEIIYRIFLLVTIVFDKRKTK